MSQTQEGLRRKQGSHSKRNETKCKLIKFILDSSGPVSEPEIRKYLEEKNDKYDQAGINRHLHQLKEKGYIKFIPAKKPKHLSRSGLPSHWDITKIEHLKNIRKSFTDIQLNKFKKSLNMVLMEYGYTIGSPQYPHFIILLFLSVSFFDMCLDKGIESVRSTALEIYRRDKDSKNESRIKKLLIECNTTYIKVRLNFEMSAERFRKTMEELALQRKEICEECAWLICGIRTENQREEYRKLYMKSDANMIESIRDNLYENPPSDPAPLLARIWVESFFKKFKEKVPELPEISIETTLTPSEYQGMYMKIKETFSLMNDQQETFEAMYLNLVFEHFLNQDMFTGIASSGEIDYMKKMKENFEEYKTLRESRDYIGAVNRLNSGDQENILKVLIKNKDVFKDVINHYGY